MYDEGQGVRQDYKEAVKWYKKAADQGYASAQYNLGVMYDEGQGVKQDYKEAVKWYKKAADQGYASAQYNLGVMYAKGQGVKQDDKEAVKWYRKAADQGHARGQDSLGFMYAKGQGVKQDDKEAVKWYKKAADQGYASAQVNLGLMYEKGRGVKQDMSKAKMLFKKACDNGLQLGCDGYRSLNEQGVQYSQSRKTVTISKTFGGSKPDYATAIIKADNGYIIAGYTESFGAGKGDAWIIKIDKNGNKIWDKTFGGSGDDKARAIIKADNGYIIAGYTESFGAGEADAWIIKIDKNGNKIWDKTFGGGKWDGADAIIKADNGYIIAGSTYSFGAGMIDAWIIKIDKNGNKIWDKTFGGSDYDEVDVIIKGDNGYIIAGDTDSFGAGEADAWIIKIDKNGNKIWDKTFGGELNDGVDAIIKADNGYIIAGNTQSFGAGEADAWIIKIDKNGNKIWDKTFGGSEYDELDAIIKADNGYIIAGHTYSFGASNADVWIIKIDKNGNKIWDKTFGGSKWDEVDAIIKADNGYIIAGMTESFGAGKEDAWVILDNKNRKP